MKKLILAVSLAIVTTAAIASCPAYAPYRCVPGAGGKMICGCGM